jgi:hypothetical protein
MNLYSKGARRTLIAAACSTAVVAAGGLAGGSALAASAQTSGLALSGSTSITTLDFGRKISATLAQSAAYTVGAGVLADNFEAATYAYHVTSTLSSTASKVALVLDSYTAPSTTSPATGSDGTDVTNAALTYAEATAASTVPDNKWKSITTNNTATNYFLTDPVSQAQVSDTHVSATQPGTYTFHFVDTGASLSGTDDDVVSSTITMTVLDAFAATGGTGDDWAPTVSVSSSALKLGAPLTSTVPLSALSVTDARGSSSGVGTLATKLGALVGFQFAGSTVASNIDLGGITDSVTASTTVNATAAVAGGFTTGLNGYTITGTNIPASTTVTYVSGTALTLSQASTGVVSTVYISSASPYHILGTTGALKSYSSAHNTYSSSSVSVTVPANTIVDAATITAGAAIDQAGTGLFVTGVPTALSTTPTTAYASSGATAWTWGPNAVVGSVKAITTSTVAVKTGTASATYAANVTAGTPLAGQVVYFTVAPGSTSDSVSANGTLVSSSSSTGQKVYSVTSDATGEADLTVTPSATSATKAYTIKANLNGVAATPSAGTTLISSGNTTATYAGSTPASVVDATHGADRYPSVGTASVTLAGELQDQFGAVAQPDSTLSQNVKVTVAGVDTYVTPVAGKFSYTYTPSPAPTAGSTTSTLFSYINGGTITDGGGLIHWVPNTAAGTVTVTAPANGASTGQTMAVGSSPAAGIAVAGTVVDAGSAAIPYKLVTLSGSDGALFSTSSTGSTGLTKTLQVGADSSGVFNGYVFYTKTGTALVTATSDTKSATSTVTTTDPIDPYKVIVKDAFTTPGGTATVSGTVTDAFGNPVPSANVNLSLGTTGLGTLASSTPLTNSGGVFSTTFTTADASSEGSATITAKLYTAVNSTVTLQTANKTANIGWATGGVTIAHGEYMDQADLEVGKAQRTTISGPSSHAAGRITLSGKAVPGVIVEIYAKPASGGGLDWIDSVESDATTGEWSATESISSSTTFVAKTSSSTSSQLTVLVSGSSAKAAIKFVTATAKGNRLVYIAVNGNGDSSTLIRYFSLSGKKWTPFKSMHAASNGARGYTIKSSKGARTFRIAYTTAHGGTAYKNVTVKVK